MSAGYLPTQDWYENHSSLLEALETDSQHYAEQARARILEDTNLSTIFRHSGWVHNRSLVAAALSRTNQSFSREHAFRECGSFSYVLRSLDDPDRYMIAGSACHDRWCQPCATTRATIVAGNVLDVVRNTEIRFLTLTVRGHPDYTLQRQLDRLYTSFGLLRRTKLWLDGVTGGVAFCELKWSERSGCWHPHLHVLIQGTWLDSVPLRAAWYRITGDSFELCIKRPANDERTARYVTKYAGKPLNNSFANRPSLLDEAVLTLFGRKLCLTFGSWRGLQLTARADEGAWEHVAPLSLLITQAAHGDSDSLHILQSLTHTNLDHILARAPPLPTPVPWTTVPPPSRQLNLDLDILYIQPATFSP